MRITWLANDEFRGHSLFYSAENVYFQFDDDSFCWKCINYYIISINEVDLILQLSYLGHKGGPFLYAGLH